MKEFELVERIRARFGRPSPSVELGVGDDAAVVAVGGGRRWALTTDALVEGVHFDLATTDPGRLGHKALAVNLSDLAAMGADPRHCLLALTLREGLDDAFVDELLAGIDRIAREHRVSVVGGNLSRGPVLSITVTAVGEIAGPPLTRSGGRPGDRLVLTGPVGASALGLALLATGRTALDDDERELVERHLAPVPRVAAGAALRGIATAGIDVSDGLVQDAGHLARASRCLARIELAGLPLPAAYDRLTAGLADRWQPALAGGEDYELLLAVPPPLLATARSVAAAAGCLLHDIGELSAGEGVEVVGPSGELRPAPEGWSHF